MNNLAGHPEADPQAGRVSDEALQALQLRTQPFVADPADGDWFADETTREQLLEIKDALINGDDLLLVCGVLNSGKSILLKQLASSSGSRIQCFSVHGSDRFNTHNLFAGLLEAFKLTPPEDMSETLNEAIPCLQALAERNTLGVIVLDDADKVSDNELMQLLGCMQYLNGGDSSLLRVLLAAEPDFESRIPELLPTESDLPYAALTIEPFTSERAEAYLEFRLNQAGHFDEFPFTDRQMQTINNTAEGLPGYLNTAAAAEINMLYGQPAPLLAKAATGNSLLDHKLAKAVIGIAGLGLILTSLYMFLPDGDAPDSDNYSVVAEKPITPTSTERIKLVQEPVATNDTTATNDAANTDADSTENAAQSIADNTKLPASGTSSIATTEQPDLTPEPSSVATTTSGTPSGTKDTTSASASGEGQKTPAIRLDTTSDGNTVAANVPSASALDSNSESTAENTSDDDKMQASADTNESTAASDDVSAKLESANWVLVQDANKYTVQLVSSIDRKSVDAFRVRHDLGSPNSIFSYRQDGRTKYAMVHGLFDTITEARQAITQMPDSAKNHKPWIRRIGQVQQSLKNK